MLKWREYAYISLLRNSKIPASYSEAKTQITSLTHDEIAQIDNWRKLTLHMDDTIYEKHSPSDLAVFLSLRTGFQCDLLPISVLFNDKNAKASLLAYYVLKGYTLPTFRPNFTPEQRELLELDTGLYIINAGPGTGKTSTVVERAWRFISEGVIIISYSNEAVKEVYKKLKEYPNSRGQISFKDFKKNYPITVTTVDSLAWYLTSRGSVLDTETTYDTVIQNAINIIRHGKTPPGLHLIVDESQDIDEDRGLLIKALYASNKYKSLFIFGDPRQRISSAGRWYINLWKSPKYIDYHYQEIIDVSRVENEVSTTTDLIFGSTERSEQPAEMKTVTYEIKITGTCKSLTVTHRFMNEQLLTLHNNLSSTRPEYDVPLHTPNILPNYGKLRAYNIGSVYSDEGLEVFSRYIYDNYIQTNFCNLSDICVIVPSVDSNNATSKRCHHLCSVFNETGLKCYTRRDGVFIPNGILISTIHSIKGKQFKIVILYCMSGFPDNYQNIPHEIADSLIYVSHTRATTELIYLYNQSFKPPRGVLSSQIEILNQTHVYSENSNKMLTPRFIHDYEVLTSRNIVKLLTLNNYKTDYTEMFSFQPSTTSTLLFSLIVKTLLNGDYLPIFKSIMNKEYELISPDVYNQHMRNGTVNYGLYKGKLILQKPIHPKISQLPLKPPEQLSIDEWILLAEVYEYALGLPKTIHKLKLDIENIHPLVAHLRPLGPFNFDQPCTFSWFNGTIDLYSQMGDVITIVSDSTTRWYPFILGSCQSKLQNMYTISVRTGKVEQITSDSHILLWRYILDAYVTIRNHLELVTIRKNRKHIPTIDYPTNIFFADTEFENSTVFDYAMVNLADPYMSIVQPMQTYSKFAPKWIADHHEFWTFSDLEILFKHGRNIKSLAPSFKHFEPSTVMYYKAKEDIQISSIYGFGGFNLSAAITKLAFKNGVSMDAMLTVRLGEIYDLIVEPLEFSKHLHQHAALSDALVLYEFFVLGYLEL